LGATILSETVFPVIAGISFFLFILFSVIMPYNNYILNYILIFTSAFFFG